MEKKPIKRHKALQPLSREHHHGLLLCWKIRTGFSKETAVERIKKYADWFFENHLVAHFEMEEKYVFPLLGKDAPLAQKAIAQHRNLERLFNSNVDLKKTLISIETELNKHIRFEERILFNEIQKVADETQLQIIENIHREIPKMEDWKDEFWLKTSV